MGDQLQDAMAQYGEYCIRVAYMYVKDWSAAEEIVQDVFLAYYEQSDRFQGRASLKTYLVKITIHKSHDYLRSWKRRWQQITTHMEVAKSAEHQVVKNQEQQQLVSALLVLPVHYREVLILYYYDDYKINEIAELLKCSENTVKTRLARGREKLKKHLCEEQWEVLLHD